MQHKYYIGLLQKLLACNASPNGSNLSPQNSTYSSIYFQNEVVATSGTIEHYIIIDFSVWNNMREENDQQIYLC